jgi:broad specificity phosphatase PhoE
MIERRRLLLMRHGAVDYFDNAGQPIKNPQSVPLTADGELQARAMGRALVSAGVYVDRVITSGLSRTTQTAALVLDAAGMALRIDCRPELEEIRAGHMGSIPNEALPDAFLGAFAGPVDEAVRFLNGETVGALLDRVLTATAKILAEDDWDTLLIVAHGGVNRAILSWFLTGQRRLLGGLEQAPGCLNIIDVAANPRDSLVRVVNYSPLDALHTSGRHSTMEQLLATYLKSRPTGS